MKNMYEDPLFEITRFSFEEILDDPLKPDNSAGEGEVEKPDPGDGGDVELP